MKKFQTRIVAGAGDDVTTALQVLNSAMNAIPVEGPWKIKHFSITQQMKVSPMDPRSMQIVYYAVAVVQVNVTFPEPDAIVMPAVMVAAKA